jgi:hypothetical protein
MGDAEYAAMQQRDKKKDLQWKAELNARYAQDVAENIAYRDGDAATRAAIEAKRRARRDRYGNGREDKCYQTYDVTASETLTGDILPPTDLSRLADLARSLMAANDPDIVRDGLREIADTLDQLEHPAAGHASDESAALQIREVSLRNLVYP